MRTTWDLLCTNPDVYSIWNMRKEFVLNKKAEYERQLEELRSSVAAELSKPKVDEEAEGDKEAAGTELKEEIKKNSEDYLEGNSGGHSEDKVEPNQEAPGKQEAGPPTEDELTSEFQKLCNDELELTEHALFKNSKSYSAWNHRLWILSLIPKPDFQREFHLNENYLKKDGRNRGYHLVHDLVA